MTSLGKQKRQSYCYVDRVCGCDGGGNRWTLLRNSEKKCLKCHKNAFLIGKCIQIIAFTRWRHEFISQVRWQQLPQNSFFQSFNFAVLEHVLSVSASRHDCETRPHCVVLPISLLCGRHHGIILWLIWPHLCQWKFGGFSDEVIRMLQTRVLAAMHVCFFCV